jgi:D-glycero-D-manno-heptose 1,7-bisphosphate phosphatase
MRQAVFLDRDGVLSRTVTRADGTCGSPRFARDFALLPGAAEAVRALRSAGLVTVVVTNQPDVARAHLAWTELQQMHSLLLRHMPLDAILTCPHDDRDRCACRKPLPGMLTRASRGLDIALERSFLVGDSLKDIAAGRAAGCRAILVGQEARRSAAAADWTAPDLPAAAAMILRELAPDRMNRLLADFERDTGLHAPPPKLVEVVKA